MQTLHKKFFFSVCQLHLLIIEDSARILTIHHEEKYTETNALQTLHKNFFFSVYFHHPQFLFNLFIGYSYTEKR